MRKPNKDRHLRSFLQTLSCSTAERKHCKTPCFSERAFSVFERDIGGDRRRNQGLRRPAIPVITPAQADEARRRFHPLRSCASECSAKDRCDPIGLAALTLTNQVGFGHPAWGWKPRPRGALPGGENHLVANERRTAAKAPTSGSLCGNGRLV